MRGWRKILALAAALGAAPSWGTEPFRFEAETSLDDMRAVIRREFSGAATRQQVRDLFIDQGGATLIAHPRLSGVEKYIYDINLCSYYVWRWNISADYARDGKLMQIYLNAAPQLHGAAAPSPPKKGPFYLLERPRPEAFKGERNLKAIVADRDANPKTTDDMQILTGVGPTRADPLDMGRALNHPGEVWRSIFDADAAKVVMPYRGDCVAVDTEMARRSAAAPRS